MELAVVNGDDARACGIDGISADDHVHEVVIGRSLMSTCRVGRGWPSREVIIY